MTIGSNLGGNIRTRCMKERKSAAIYRAAFY